MFNLFCSKCYPELLQSKQPSCVGYSQPNSCYPWSSIFEACYRQILTTGTCRGIIAKIIHSNYYNCIYLYTIEIGIIQMCTVLHFPIVFTQIYDKRKLCNIMKIKY